MGTVVLVLMSAQTRAARSEQRAYPMLSILQSSIILVYLFHVRYEPGISLFISIYCSLPHSPINPSRYYCGAQAEQHHRPTRSTEKRQAGSGFQKEFRFRGNRLCLRKATTFARTNANAECFPPPPSLHNGTVQRDLMESPRVNGIHWTPRMGL